MSLQWQPEPKCQFFNDRYLSKNFLFVTHRKTIYENPQIKYPPDLVRMFENKPYESKMKLS